MWNSDFLLTSFEQYIGSAEATLWYKNLSKWAKTMGVVWNQKHGEPKMIYLKILALKKYWWNEPAEH